MERSSFFNSVNRDRRYKAEDFARYFASFIGNGVFPIPSNGLQVISNNNMTVTLKPGKAWINGYFYWNDNDLVLNIEPADGILNRIDRVVIRLDYLKREIKTYVKKGNFASSPAAPTLVRNADMYELGIADIKVNKGAISISNANITDTRLNKSLCGIVHGVIEQIDPTELFNQYQLYLNEKINSNEFSDWLNSLKDKLDPNSDLAVQLQVQIDSLVSQVEEMNNKIENIDLSADKVILSNPNLKSTNVNDGLTELFQYADNGKKNWVDVIGSPLLNTDSFSTLKSKTQTLKNTFASNLSSKKVSASGTESLNSLISKVGKIELGNTIKSIQNGTATAPRKYTGKITISPVNLDKSILLCKSATYEARKKVMANLINNTTIEIKTYHEYATQCNWTVIEFDNIKSIQNGIAEPVLYPDKTYDIPINGVNPEKSIVILQGNRGSDSSGWEAQYFYTLESKNNIQITIISDSSNYQWHFYWYVVEFY